MMYKLLMFTRPKGAYWQRESEYIIICMYTGNTITYQILYSNDLDSLM